MLVPLCVSLLPSNGFVISAALTLPSYPCCSSSILNSFCIFGIPSMRIDPDSGCLLLLSKSPSKLDQVIRGAYPLLRLPALFPFRSSLPPTVWTAFNILRFLTFSSLHCFSHSCLLELDGQEMILRRHSSNHGMALLSAHLARTRMSVLRAAYHPQGV